MDNDLMIEVEELTRRFAGQEAVSRLSFTVRRGEIVALLGHNGAGKSTTMRILACFLPASSGTARVAGLDIYQHADEVRRRIGYMPENNPLYPEMRVREYLKFRARLKGLGRRQSRQRVDMVMEKFGLVETGRKLIGHLSKGFRQRVGLADALVHDPEVLILDEPTIGLDPEQVRTLRQLITDLGRTHTILLSTHNLPEAEMTCSRVLIMHQGQIKAEGAPSLLQEQMHWHAQVIAEIAAPEAGLKACLESMQTLASWNLAPGNDGFIRCELTSSDGADLRPLVFNMVREQGWGLRELTRQRRTLEDIYLRVTRPGEEEED
jgi:ABC-2 type transport system ATP-binding protein